MKAILVIDMPKNCEECPLNSNGYCDALQEYALLNEWVEDAPYYDLKGKGDCLLKPMPGIKTDEAIKLANMINPKATFQEFADGWNACLDAITGETE